VRTRLGEPWPALRLLAEDLLAAETAIDWVGVDAQGSAVAVLVGEAGRDLELVARALAHLAWLGPRLRGFLQLSQSGAGVRPEAPVRALALCAAFGAEAVAAAAAAPGGALSLGVLRCLRDGAGLHVLVEPLLPAPSPLRPAAGGPAPEAARSEPFRTSLTDADLDLAGDARAEPEPLPAPLGARR
jgi:hypothetical protein